MHSTRVSRRIARDVFLRRLGIERSYRPPTLFRHPDWNFDHLLKLVVTYHLRARPDFTFLQVGAFDGLANDPIHPLVRAFGLRGLVVEPQVGVLDRLRATYADHPQVSLVNAAVADANHAHSREAASGLQCRQRQYHAAAALEFGQESGGQGFFVSLTHLRFDRRSGLTREIVAYQKHRTKRLLRFDRLS